jgi:fatty-acyl-CoA synthase
MTTNALSAAGNAVGTAVGAVTAPARHLALRVATEARAVAVLHQAGMTEPKVATKVLHTNRVWKSVLAAGYAAWAELTPERTALADEAGNLTFREVHERTNAVAHGLLAEGIREGDVVAVLCHNHRGFIDAAVGAAKVGCDVVLCNTGFGTPQLRDVLEREGAKVLFCDAEFAPLLDDLGGDRLVVLAEDTCGGTTLSVGDLLRRHLVTDPPLPRHTPRLVILTSGTTGTPKGANRPSPSPLPSTAAAMFSRIPYRLNQVFVISAPMFHAWGLAQMLIAANAGSTVVVRRHFDAEQVLADVAYWHADVLAVVPVMLQRILALPEATRSARNTASLQIVASSGSALPAPLATAWMDAFGDHLYNFYGSTEVAQAAVATPDDMRAAPGTAGRPPLGTTLRILDEHGHQVPHGVTGRVFVANGMQFDGYTGGGGKEIVDGLMSTGDIGHLDADGRLFVEGRDDDMIVSGGENVFPSEVEDLLLTHPGVADAAVIGVDDPEFGQRLAAFVVRRPAEADGGTHPDTDAAAQPVDADALRAFVREQLAAYKVPRTVEFVDELPRNPTGKLLRRVLRDA